MLTDPNCSGDTLNTSTFYVESCEKDYLSDVIKKAEKEHNDPPKFVIKKTDCYTLPLEK
jgi:hypothetical protein